MLQLADRVINATFNPIPIAESKTIQRLQRYRLELRGMIYLECGNELKGKITEFTSNQYHLSAELTSQLKGVITHSPNLPKMEEICTLIEEIIDHTIKLLK